MKFILFAVVIFCCLWTVELSTDPCKGRATFVKRSLEKTGFHRDLYTSFQLLQEPDFALDQRCTYLLLENFPPQIFLDRYQIAELERLGRAEHRVLVPEMDLEKPAYHPDISATNVMILVPYKFASFSPTHSWNLTVLIHFRYEQPSDSHTYHEFILEDPQLFLTCASSVMPSISTKALGAGVLSHQWTPICTEKGEIGEQGDRRKEGEGLKCSIPVGNKKELDIVLILTFTTTSLAALLILFLLYCYSPPPSATTFQKSLK